MRKPISYNGMPLFVTSSNGKHLPMKGHFVEFGVWEGSTAAVVDINGLPYVTTLNCLLFNDSGVDFNLEDPANPYHRDTQTHLAWIYGLIGNASMLDNLNCGCSERDRAAFREGRVRRNELTGWKDSA